MKKNKLLLPFVIFSMGMSFQNEAQITITESNFPKLTAYIDTAYFTEQGGIAVPTEGPNQVWDYSTLQYSLIKTSERFDASGDVNFTGALNYYSSPLEFQAFPIQSNLYSAVDQNGLYNLGRTIEDVTYSISAISGGVNDSIRFVGGAYPYNGRVDIVQFPMTYENEWSQTRIRTIDFELDIAAYNLVNTPGAQRVTLTQSQKVVGYGKLTFPNPDGTPSLPTDVLLVKVDVMSIDSLFLGGAPGPAPLISAFGLIQGDTTTSTFYSFFKTDFSRPLIDFRINENNEVEYAHFWAPPKSTTTSIEDLSITELKPFPNPVESGQNLNIQLETPLNSGSISFFSIDGRLVHKANMKDSFGNNFQVTIPESMTEGLYTIQIKDGSDKPVAKGKLFVK